MCCPYQAPALRDRVAALLLLSTFPSVSPHWLWQTCSTSARTAQPRAQASNQLRAANSSSRKPSPTPPIAHHTPPTTPASQARRSAERRVRHELVSKVHP